MTHMIKRINAQFSSFPIDDISNMAFLGHAGGLWKFLGQGSNQSHSSNLSHNSANAKSLTLRSPGNSQ